mgnify:CR=1 FL=1
MPRTSDFIAAASARLETVLFPGSLPDWPQGFTEYGRERVDQFLNEFDEAAFNAGFNAAVEAILGETGICHVHVNHPQFLKDRSEAYRKARGA